MCECFRWKIHPYCISASKNCRHLFLFFFSFLILGEVRDLHAKNHVCLSGISFHTMEHFTRNCLSQHKGPGVFGFNQKFRELKLPKNYRFAFQSNSDFWQWVSHLTIMRCLLLSQFEAAGASTRGRVWNIVGSKSDRRNALPILYLGELSRRGFFMTKISCLLSFLSALLISKSGECRKYSFRMFHVTASGHFRLSSISFRKTSQPSHSN